MDNRSLFYDSSEHDNMEMSGLNRVPTTQPSARPFYMDQTPSREGKQKPWCPRKIVFDLYEHSEVKASPSQYLRISSNETEENLMKDIENRVFKDKFYPELAITFLGGCEEQLLTEAVKKCLRECISSILGKFKCCFITRGSCVGITKLVGKIFSTETLKWNYGCKSKSIGILPWLNVRGRENLPSEQGDTIITYPKLSLIPATSSTATEWPLDPNQDYYYFVDNGCDSAASRVDTDFIVNLNKMMLQGKIKENKQYAVPCVMILTGGGKQSFEVMHNFLQYNEPPPTLKPVVIIIKGSGKLADLLSYLVEAIPRDKNFDDELEKAEKTYEEHPLKDQRSIFVKKLKEIPKYDQMMKAIMVDHIDQIFVFKIEEGPDTKPDLEKVLLKAVMSSGVVEYMSFVFAIFAGQTETVRRHFTDDPYMVFKVMTNSILKSNNLTRAKEILEKYKFNVEDYVKKNLKKLYKLDGAIRPRVNVSEFDPIKLLEFFKTRYRKSDNNMLDLDATMKDLTDGSTISIDDMLDDDMLESHATMKDPSCGCNIARKNDNQKVVNPIQKLFINSIHFLDVNAAKLFWNFDPYNPLSNALLAYSLLNGLRKEATEVAKSAPNDFKQALKYFESLVCAVLETYYKIDQGMAQKVLCKKVPLWNDRTVIDMAGDIGLKSFFSQQACQRIMEEAWYEVIKEDDKEKASRKRSKCILPEIVAPIWKMRLHLFVYLVSLGSFAFYVLFANTVAHEPIKWTVAAIVFSLAVDEIRQITDYKKGCRRNIWQWISSIWNQFDLAAILLFFSGLGFSFYHKYVSKVLFSIYLVVSCLKVMQFLRAMDFIGVYLVMIYKMLGRMKMFLIVFLVTILGYGLFMTALLHPEASLDWTVLFQILFRPSLMLIGEPGIEYFQLSNSTTIYGSEKVDLVSEILVIIGMAVFLLFANILLVNLVIADFSNIHSEVSCISEEIWRYEQYLLLQEFRSKPNFPIPFSIFENLWSLLRRLLKKITRCCESNRQPFPNAAENELAKSKEELAESKEELAKSEEELAKREIEEFERFCFKKRFPKIPDDIIYPVTEEDIRSKMKIPVDDESFRSLERPDGEMKLPKIYLTRD